MNIEEERKAFESMQSPIIFERIQFSESNNCYMIKDGYYYDLMVNAKCNELNFGWEMWQASVNREGYKLVPVDKMMGCLYQIGDRSYVDDNVSELKAMIGAAE